MDPAGVRKPRRIDNSIEFFSVKRTEDSIARSDITLLVLDTETGIQEQDKKIADKINEEQRACIVVINKWDLVAENVREARAKEIAWRQKKERREAPKPIPTLAGVSPWGPGQLFC